jgi:hypothetical protein
VLPDFPSSSSGAQSGGIEGISGVEAVASVVVAEAVAGSGAGAGEAAVGEPVVGEAVVGDAGRMSGSTAGVSREPAELSPNKEAPPSFTAASSETLRGPDALAGGLTTSGAGSVPAEEETSTTAQSAPIKEGAIHLFTTSPALLGHPGDHPAPEYLRPH